MRLALFLLIFAFGFVVGQDTPTLPPVPPGATPEPTFAPITLTVITKQGEADDVTVGLIVVLAAAGILGLTTVGVLMVNWYSSDYDMGVSDEQIIDVNKLRDDLAMYKELAAGRSM